MIDIAIYLGADKETAENELKVQKYLLRINIDLKDWPELFHQPTRTQVFLTIQQFIWSREVFCKGLGVEKCHTSLPGGFLKV